MVVLYNFMKSFIEWVEENHHESMDEDWKKWARNAALGTAMAGAGLGLMQQSPQATPQPQQASQQTQQPSRYQQAFHSKHKEKQRQNLRSKGENLKQAGRKSGIFVQGQLQDGPRHSKQIQNKSTTSADAADFL